MKLVKLILVCLLTLGICCCNQNGNKIPMQKTDCTDSIGFELNRQKVEFDGEFTKVFTMKKKDSAIIGDVYVKFENDSLFRYLYVINKSDTVYSIKNTVFSRAMSLLEDNKIIDDWDYDPNKIGVSDFGGYRFTIINSDFIEIELCNTNGVAYDNIPDKPADGLYATVQWDYGNNILMFPLN